MKTQTRSIEQIVEAQVQRWQLLKKETPAVRKAPVITISREPGSGGNIVAEALARELGFEVLHQEMIHQMAESAHVHHRILETVDEKGMNILEESISSIVNERHLWPDEYLRYLMRLVGVIGKHGNVILIGRGCNFILPPESRLRVRVIAPREARIDNVVREHHVDREEARRHIIRAESQRRAFIRKYYNTDIADPHNYDLVVNTGALDIPGAVRAVRGALGL